MSNTQQLFSAGRSRGEGQEKANQLVKPASEKASQAAQSASESKEQAAGFLHQQVTHMAHEAADAVKNAVGLGDPGAAGTGSTTTRTTTTTTKQQ